MTMSARISGLVLLAGLVGACAADEDEQAGKEEVAAVGDLQNDLEMAGPGPMGDGPMGGPGPGAFLQCDPDPEVELGTVCGRTLPVSAHFEWSDCESEMGTSSGTADISTASDDCTAGIEHQVSFAVTHSLPFGDGSATATGDLVMALTAGHQATIDGAVSVALPFGDAATTITGLVRVPPSECQYPIAGSVERTLPDGTSHTLEFGPACGQATADGEQVDLATWRPPGPGPGF